MLRFQPKILVLDKDTGYCSSVKLMLKREDYEADSFSKPPYALKIILREEIDILLLENSFFENDIGQSTRQFLEKFTARYPLTPVIILVEPDDFPNAVENLKTGAVDYILKSREFEPLLETVKLRLEMTAVPDINFPRSELNHFDHIIGNHPDLLKALNTAKRLAPTKANMLIIGEAGTGKRLLAEAIHLENFGENQPLVTLSGLELTPALFEKTLFGEGIINEISDLGALNRAVGGTLIITGIETLELSVQERLLPIIKKEAVKNPITQESETYDVRIITTADVDIEKLMVAGEFRFDLFFKLNSVAIKLPALKDRREDIPMLVNFFVNNLIRLLKRPGLYVEGFALHQLKQLPFPGNIRQLQKLVLKTVLLSKDNKITAEEFIKVYEAVAPPGIFNIAEIGPLSVEEVNILLLKQALILSKQDTLKAANLLGITHHALFTKINKYEIKP